MAGRAVVADVADGARRQTPVSGFFNSLIGSHHHGRVTEAAVPVDEDGRLRLFDDSDVGIGVDLLVAEALTVTANLTRAVGAHAAQIAIGQQDHQLLGVIGLHSGGFEAVSRKLAQALRGNAFECAGWKVHLTSLDSS